MLTPKQPKYILETCSDCNGIASFTHTHSCRVCRQNGYIQSICGVCNNIGQCKSCNGAGIRKSKYNTFDKRNIIKQGWMKKKSRYLKIWRLRWTVLTRNYLYTFKNKCVYGNATETIPLSSITNIQSLTHRTDFSLTISEDNKDIIFYFQTETNSNAVEWRNSILKSPLNNICKACSKSGLCYNCSGLGILTNQCRNCNGIGSYTKTTSCQSCRGKGIKKIKNYKRTQIHITCNRCDGSELCDTCDGFGKTITRAIVCSQCDGGQCSTCSGYGCFKNTHTCEKCSGMGTGGSYYDYLEERVCSKCLGRSCRFCNCTGFVTVTTSCNDDVCVSCKGSGTITVRTDCIECENGVCCGCWGTGIYRPEQVHKCTDCNASGNCCQCNGGGVIINKCSLPPIRRDKPVHGIRILRLYHITDRDGANGIQNDNYKMIRGSNGMFGGGIYFAHTVQDAKYKAKHNGYLVTANVHVGIEYIIPKFQTKYKRLTFTELYNQGFDSVYAPNGSGSGQPERVVYNYDQVQILNIEKI